jgi:hypothetical protein
MPLLRIIGVTVSVFMLACPASAQNFMVRPVKVEVAIRPGQTVTQTIELVNNADTRAILNLRLIELSQWENGTWQGLEPDSNNIDTSKQLSCREWITLSASSVSVGPLATGSVTLTIKAPPNARGFYAAAFIAQMRVKEMEVKEVGVGVIIRFLVPIFVNIQARAVRSKINISDVGMEFSEQRAEKPATTLVSMKVVNEGRTCSGLRPSVVVRYLTEGHWREITTAEFMEVGILPGITLNLKSDIMRSLPSGKYKLSGMLFVDGRRVKPIEKEIDFVGDKNIIAATADAALDLEPATISIKSVPGATRTAILKVHNASDSAVNIKTALLIPHVLKGVVFGDLKGEDLSCDKWLKVVPDEFTLRAGGRQNIRIVEKTPKAESMHANYYATVGLGARYTDGQNAGVTTSLISIRNKKVQAKALIQPMKLTLAVDEENKYVIVSKFGNVGNVHITPKCTARLITAVDRVAARILLAGKQGPILPLEFRDFSGILDFSSVPVGAYRIEATLEYITDEEVSGQASSTIPIRVTAEGKQKIVEIIE